MASPGTADFVASVYKLQSLIVLVPILWIQLTLPASLPGKPKGLYETNHPRVCRAYRVSDFDFVGLVLLIASVSSAMAVLEIGGSRASWTNPLVISLDVGAIVLGSAFVTTELRVARSPLVRLSLLRYRGVAAAVVCNALTMGAYVMVRR